MKKTPKAARRKVPQSLHDHLAKSFGPVLAGPFSSLFDHSEVKTLDGRYYKVGHIIREAWGGEKALPSHIVSDAGLLIKRIIEKESLVSYATPACCSYHGATVVRYFPDPAVYPQPTELLYAITQAVWALLPHARGTLQMGRLKKSKSILTSRFMTLDFFLQRHDVTVISKLHDLAAQHEKFRREYDAGREPAVRRKALRKSIGVGQLKGMVGAFPADNPLATRSPFYCHQRRPFSTPTANIPESERMAKAPDRILQRLGVEFGPNQRWVELIYRVPFDPKAKAGAKPSIPSVIDAEGYWLFRPDRAQGGTDGLTWNHARDIATNGRGHEELISPPLSITQLEDLIVWPHKTTSAWSNGASDDLTRFSRAVP